MEIWIPSVSGKINKSSKSNGSRGDVRGARPAGRGSQPPSRPGPPGPAVFQLPGYVPCLPGRSSRAIRSSGFRSLSMYFSLRSHTHLTLSHSPDSVSLPATAHMCTGWPRQSLTWRDLPDSPVPPHHVAPLLPSPIFTHLWVFPTLWGPQKL